MGFLSYYHFTQVLYSLTIMNYQATITLTTEAVDELLRPYLEAWKAEYFASLPALDPWLTIPEAAAYAKMTPAYMAQLVLGKPFRTSTPEQPERAAVTPKIPSGNTGFGRGARVKQSAIDAYLMRHQYKQARFAKSGTA